MTATEARSSGEIQKGHYLHEKYDDFHDTYILYYFYHIVVPLTGEKNHGNMSNIIDKIHDNITQYPVQSSSFQLL